MKGEVMDVVLFMMRQLNDLKMDKNQNLAYVPYIMALIKAKTIFEGRCETAHTPFRPFKNEIGFLTRPLTLFPNDEGAQEDAFDAQLEVHPAQQMPPPPPPQQGQYWQPTPGYSYPYFQQMHQGLQTHIDGLFQGMMSHVDDRFDHMQSTFDGQFSDLHDRFTVVDSQLDEVHTQFTDFRSHIQSTMHDPIMSRMNNMQQSFQDNMSALSSQFESRSTSDSIHSLDERQQQLHNDFSQFTSIFDSFSSHFYNMYPRPPPGAQ
jgi:hypothetical protein